MTHPPLRRGHKIAWRKVLERLVEGRTFSARFISRHEATRIADAMNAILRETCMGHEDNEIPIRFSVFRLGFLLWGIRCSRRETPGDGLAAIRRQRRLDAQEADGGATESVER